MPSGTEARVVDQQVDSLIDPQVEMADILIKNIENRAGDIFEQYKSQIAQELQSLISAQGFPEGTDNKLRLLITLSDSVLVKYLISSKDGLASYHRDDLIAIRRTTLKEFERNFGQTPVSKRDAEDVLDVIINGLLDVAAGETSEG